MIYQTTCYIQASDRKIFGFLSPDGNTFFCQVNFLEWAPKSSFYSLPSDVRRIDVTGWARCRVVDRVTGHQDFVLFPF
jgi:hypothetical protein